MRSFQTCVMLLAAGLCLLTVSRQLPAQSRSALHPAWAANTIVPQSRSWTPQASDSVHVTAVDVGVVILDQVATTTLDLQLANRSGQRQTAEILLPVPAGAAIRGFTFQGAASEPTAKLLQHEDARKTFDAIVAKMKDPALLEFAGMNLIRSSVFPVDAGGSQKVRLTYEHLLEADGDRVDYVLPRSQSVLYDVPWKVSVKIQSARTLAAVYSPSHPLETRHVSPHQVATRIADHGQREPGTFRLSYLMQRGAVTASLFAYPNADHQGGYFLLLAGLDHGVAERGADQPAMRRELTLVLDRSGSMNGEKLEQARQAALQVLGGLQPEETFNVIVYNEAVLKFADRPVQKTAESMLAVRGFLEQVTAIGGTNIHDALQEAMAPKPSPEVLPIVLFLTDGLPTVGQTSEAAIRKLATDANPHQRRIFTFGVGVDVNTPLLDKLAVSSRGFSTFVLPGEDVEVKVGTVFKGLQGPLLADAQLHVVGPNGRPQPGRVMDLLPGQLPDLFQGDQLVLLGRYVGNQPLGFELTGTQAGQQRRFRFQFSLEKGTVRNAFVPRLWASRQIARLTDQIRDLGAQPSTADMNQDPRLKELTDDIIRLSTEFGILTEYTSFLALEGTDLTQRDQVLAEARQNFQQRAIGVRSGLASINQETNNALQRTQYCLNTTNGYLNAQMQRVAVSTVQQVCDAAFYRRGNRWVDSRYVERQDVEPTRVVVFGSEEFSRLVRDLVKDGRQPIVSLEGDILLQIDGKPVLIQGPPPVNQPVNQPANQPVNQPVNQPAEE